MLIAIVVGDVVGINNISSGMAVKFFFMAMTIFIGPPIAGKFIYANELGVILPLSI